MDLATTFCPNRDCPARGQIGQATLGFTRAKSSASSASSVKDLHHDHRHGLLPGAHAGRDDQLGDHADGAWLSLASHRGRLWL